MSITSFEAHRFRNFKHLKITPSPRLNIIYGANGSGKTSLLEALYYMGRARSFRTTHLHNIISSDETDFLCFATIDDYQENHHKLGIQRQGKQQTIKLNGEVLQRASDLARILPLQIINNDVHHLIEGSPKLRRQFLDWGVFHNNKHFGQVSKKYRQILKQRNAALKHKWKRGQVKHWDQGLIDFGQQIDSMRIEYLEHFIPQLENIMADSFNLPSLSIKYRHGWEKGIDLPTALDNAWQTDLLRGITHCGPHKADLVFTSDQYALKEVVSRGQQKILSTLFVLTQIKLYGMLQTSVSPETLVLLIDDLPAELDQEFSSYFLEKILQTKSQLFVTATESHLINTLERHSCKMFHVEHGHISEDSVAASSALSEVTNSQTESAE